MKAGIERGSIRWRASYKLVEGLGGWGVKKTEEINQIVLVFVSQLKQLAFCKGGCQVE